MPIYKTEGNIEYKLVIEQEQDGIESPREWDNLGTLVTAHRRYSGDEELPSNASDIDEAFDIHLKSKGLTIDDVYYHKVWLYEHSGVRISINPFPCNWDSGQWGYIYVSKEKYNKECLMPKDGETHEQTALEILADEIRLLDQWYSGDIYGFVIESRKFIDKEERYYTMWETQDACGGYYGGEGLAEEMNESQDIFTLEEIKNYIHNKI